MNDTRARSEARGRMELNREAVDRFATACQTNDSVIAAFLGGSLASGRADEESDLDLYVVVPESEYEGFLTRSEEFLRSWGDVVFSTTILNFENLGFDMVLFAMADGVEGELALATERNFMATHGGPHRVLADRKALLADVEFPLLSFDDRPSKGQVDQALWSFWWEIRSVVKAWARHQWWAAAQALAAVRSRCLLLARAAGAQDARDVLAPTFAPLEKAALAEAVVTAVRAYLAWGPEAARSAGTAYPEGLAEVGSRRIERSLGRKGEGRRD